MIRIKDFEIIFLKYFDELRNKDIVKRSKDGEPLTAALLYAIEGSMMFPCCPVRITKKFSKRTMWLFRNIFDSRGMGVFMLAASNMQKILDGTLEVRGEWEREDQRAMSHDPLTSLWVFFADCIVFDNLLINYETAEVPWIDPFTMLDIRTEILTSVFVTVANFTNELAKPLHLN